MAYNRFRTVYLPGAFDRDIYGMAFKASQIITASRWWFYERSLTGDPWNPLDRPIVLLFITAIFYVVKGIKGSNTMATSDAVSLMKTMLIMRLIQIPGYIILFFLAALFLLTIFTIGFSIILIILDVISICITGMIAAPVYLTLRKNGLINRLQSTLYSIFSFFFVLDVITAIVCYRKVKKNSKNNN